MFGKRKENIPAPEVKPEGRQFQITHRLNNQQAEEFADMEKFYGFPPGKSEVAMYNKAIRLLKWATRVRRAGAEVYIKDEDGDLLPINWDKFDIDEGT